MNERLCEYVDSRGATIRVDRSAGVIRGVKILGPVSRNGRIYTADAMRSATPLYEGAKVNVNHPEGRPDRPRDYRDRIGTIRGVTFRDEGLFGDLHFNPKHELAEQLIWDATHAPENVGFSHNIEAKTSSDGERLRVERILCVYSVDLVADPATTAGLFESETAKDAQTVDESTETSETSDAESAAETFESTIETAEGSESGDRVSESSVQEADDTPDRCETLTEENETLRRKIRFLARRETIDRLLREYSLPSADSTDRDDRAIVDDQFLMSLTEAENERTMRGILERRIRLIQAAARRSESLTDAVHPISREQPVETFAGGSSPHSRPTRASAVAQFVEAITGSGPDC